VEICERLPELTRLTFDEVSLEITPDGRAYAVSLDGHTHRLEILGLASARLELLIDGRRVEAYVNSDGRRHWVTVQGRTFLITKSVAASARATAHDSSSDLIAPMPGQVRIISVKTGEAVTRGQTLAVIEAMKMEIRLQAPFDGTVSSVEASVGQTVEREQILVKLQRT
jgi:acetyl/propionyl-CoA carboxylase alpha subunit